MAGLRPFRDVPRDLKEWTLWCLAQNIVSTAELEAALTALGLGDDATTGVDHDHIWQIRDISGDYTLKEEDAGYLLRTTSLLDSNIYVPSGIFRKGVQITVMQLSIGIPTFVAQGATTLRTPTTTYFNEQYGTITLIHLGTEEWVLAGRMAAS